MQEQNDWIHFRENSCGELFKGIGNDTTEVVLTFCIPSLNFAQPMSPVLEFP